MAENMYKGYAITPDGQAVPVGDPGAVRTGDVVGVAENSNKLGGQPPDYYLPANATAANANKLGGKMPEYYLPAVNLLDNSDFTNAINQRGLTSYGEGYGIDRWYSWGGTTVHDGYVKFNSPFQNILRKKLPPVGTPVTIALCHDGGLNIGHFTIPAVGATRQASDIFLCYSTAFPADDDYIRFEWGGGRNCLWAALYEGTYTAETLPPFVPPDPMMELLKCKYRYQKYRFTAWMPIGSGFSSNTATAYLFFPLEVQLADDINISLKMTGDILYRVNGKTYNIDASTGRAFSHNNMLAIEFPGLSIDSSNLHSAGFFLAAGTGTLTVEIDVEL